MPRRSAKSKKSARSTTPTVPPVEMILIRQMDLAYPSGIQSFTLLPEDTLTEKGGVLTVHFAAERRIAHFEPQNRDWWALSEREQPKRKGLSEAEQAVLIQQELGEDE